jgi:hypothetical protein
MTVDQAYALIKYIANKNQSGAPSPSEVGRILTSACRSYQAFLLGQEEQFSPGRPVPRVGLGMGETLRMSLQPLLVPPTALTITSGVAELPEDCAAIDAVYKSDGYTKIRYAEPDRLQGYVESVIDPIGENPCYVLNASGLTFYPTDLSAAKIAYVRVHPEVVWAYTADANGRPTYTATGSAHPLFGDTDMLQVIARALRMIGVSLQNASVAQYAQEIKGAGQ